MNSLNNFHAKLQKLTISRILGAEMRIVAPQKQKENWRG